MAKNTPDVAGVALAGVALHVVSDIDIIVAGCLEPGAVAQGNVVRAADVIEEREITDRYIAEASCIVTERFVAERVVALYGGIGKRLETNGCAEPADLGRGERVKTYRRIRTGLSVLVERRVPCLVLPRCRRCRRESRL